MSSLHEESNGFIPVTKAYGSTATHPSEKAVRITGSIITYTPALFDGWYKEATGEDVPTSASLALRFYYNPKKRDRLRITPTLDFDDPDTYRCWKSSGNKGDVGRSGISSTIPGTLRKLKYSKGTYFAAKGDDGLFILVEPWNGSSKLRAQPVDEGTSDENEVVDDYSDTPQVGDQVAFTARGRQQKGAPGIQSEIVAIGVVTKLVEATLKTSAFLRAISKNWESLGRDVILPLPIDIKHLTVVKKGPRK